MCAGQGCIKLTERSPKPPKTQKLTARRRDHEQQGARPQARPLWSTSSTSM